MNIFCGYRKDDSVHFHLPGQQFLLTMCYSVLSARHKICSVRSHLKQAPEAAADFFYSFDEIIASAYVFWQSYATFRGVCVKDINIYIL